MHITKFQYLRITYPWIEKSAKETFSFKLKKKINIYDYVHCFIQYRIL